MHIRPFKQDDAEAVVKLWEACALTRPWNNPRKDIERKQAVQPELFIVGELDGAIVATAMAGYDGHRGSVYYLAVSPSCQTRGLGRQLMNEVEAKLLAMGCPKLNILVRSSNAAVLAFYRKLGYRVDETSCLGKRLIPDL